MKCQAAKQTKLRKEGWVQIPGCEGDMPVSGDVRVDTIFRNGEVNLNLRARDWSWGNTSGSYSIEWYRLTPL